MEEQPLCTVIKRSGALKSFEERGRDSKAGYMGEKDRGKVGRI